MAQPRKGLPTKSQLCIPRYLALLDSQGPLQGSKGHEDNGPRETAMRRPELRRSDEVSAGCKIPEASAKWRKGSQRWQSHSRGRADSVAGDEPSPKQWPHKPASDASKPARSRGNQAYKTPCLGLALQVSGCASLVRNGQTGPHLGVVQTSSMCGANFVPSRCLKQEMDAHIFCGPLDMQLFLLTSRQVPVSIP